MFFRIVYIDGYIIYGFISIIKFSHLYIGSVIITGIQSAGFLLNLNGVLGISFYKLKFSFGFADDNILIIICIGLSE